MIIAIETQRIISEAANLISEDSENSEYDRAIGELLVDIGLGPSVEPTLCALRAIRAGNALEGWGTFGSWLIQKGES